MIVIRQYSEKDREQIIELWKICNSLIKFKNRTNICYSSKGDFYDSYGDARL